MKKGGTSMKQYIVRYRPYARSRRTIRALTLFGADTQKEALFLARKMLKTEAPPGSLIAVYEMR